MELRERLSSELAARYEIESELARGGMSIVFLARDVRHDRLVALKVLDPELAHTVGAQRFIREIRICARLSHPNILPLLDSGEIGGLPFYVTPYVPGPTLRDRISREAQLPIEDVLRITTDVADALECAHAAGVLHRDIKPDNILLSDGKALVADFGIAHAVARAAGETLTRSGVSVGTPTYMSPEQASSEATLDGRSDLYSLACVAYEMLTGSPPFTGRTAQAIVARHLAEPPSSIRTVRPGVPEGVEEVVRRGLAKVPADRFGSPRAFAQALERGLRARPRTRVRAGPYGLAGVVAILLVGWWWNSQAAARAIDSNAVVVFPLIDQGGEPGTGEGVASLLGYVLDGTEPLRWIEGWQLLDGAAREQPERVDATMARSLAVRAGAAYFVTGRIVTSGDSTTVILSLHDARNGSVVKRSGAAGTSSDAVTELALRAVPALLFPLLTPGSTVDPGLLANRAPSALVNFYLGEGDYRRGRFSDALEHYQRASQLDSTMALAALRGAETAMELKRLGEARAAADLADRHAELIPEPYRPMARAIRLLLAGDVDSALVQVRMHLAQRPASTAGWTLVGEALLHHFPSTTDPDGEAESALRHALDLDGSYVPVMYHLIELAMLRGDASEAQRIWTDMAGAELPEEIRSHVVLLLACLNGIGTGAWKSAVDQASTASRLSVGYLLAPSAGYRACAIDVLDRVVGTGDAATGVRFAALEALGSAFVGAGAPDEAHTRTTAASSWSPNAPYLHLLWDVAAGSTSGEGRAQAASMWASGLAGRPPSLLWLLGTWEALRGSAALADSVSALLRGGGGATARELGAAVAAEVDAATGQSDDALKILRTLRVHAPVDQLQWNFWTALYPERILRARLLRERGDTTEADAIVEALVPGGYPRTVVSAAFGPAIGSLRR